MRYENNGLEIQYRECQILRDAAKGLLTDAENTKSLVDQRDKWIQAIRDIADASEAKGKYAIPVVKFLSCMREEYLEAVAEKGRVLISWYRLLRQTKSWFCQSIHILLYGNIMMKM